MFSAGRVLLMPKGAYNPLTTYEMLDIVSYNGSSYIAKGTTTGNLPTDTTYWQLSAYGGQAANIAGNFAELESSSVATAIHYVDDIFVDENSQLMKATQTINIGDTIDANVNCAPTTVEALIAYLSSYVDSLDSLNKKIQGAIEIAAQTDLHSLAIGEYYKKQSTFYVTNGPTGIDQDPTAIFRLTVEAALDNASQASSPLLLTLRTPDGKIYTQSFDGTNWGSWVEVASAASVSALNTAKQPKTLDTPITVGGVQQTTVEGALGSINQTLTNKVTEESSIRDVLGAKNILPNKLISGTYYGVTFVNNGDGTITANGTYSEANAVLLSNGWSDTDLSWITPFIGKKIRVKCGVVGIDFAIRFYDSANTNIGQIESGYNGEWGEGTVPSGIHHYAAYLFPSGTITLTDALVFPRADYEPYAMTNQELTNRKLVVTSGAVTSDQTTVSAAMADLYSKIEAVTSSLSAGQLLVLKRVSIAQTRAADVPITFAHHNLNDVIYANVNEVGVSAAILANFVIYANSANNSALLCAIDGNGVTFSNVISNTISGTSSITYDIVECA